MSLNNRWGQKKEKDLNERLLKVLREKNNVDGDDKHFIDNLIRSLTGIGSEVWTAAGFRTPHASEEWKRTQKDWFDGECDKIKATINHKSSTFDADLNSLQSAVQKLIDDSAFDECPGMDTFIEEEKIKRNEYLFKKEGNKLLIEIDQTGDAEGFQKRLQQLENDLVKLEQTYNLTRDDIMKNEISKMQHLLQVKQFNEACDVMLTALDPKSASFESDIKTLEQKWSNLLTKYKQILVNDEGKKNSELVNTYIKEMKEEWETQKKMCDAALQHSGWKKSDSLIPQEEIKDKRNDFKEKYNKDCYNDDKLNEEISRLDKEDEKYNEAQQKYEDEQKQKYSQKFCDNILANIPPEVTSADFESEMDKPMREVENNIRKGKGQEPCGEETSYIMGVPTIFPCPVPNDVKANTCSNYDDELDKRKERENLIKEREEILNQTTGENHLTSSQLREKIQGLKNIQGDKAIQELTTQLNNRIIELEKEEQLELLKGFSKKITDTPPEGITYSKTLEVYKKEWKIFSDKHTWQNNNNAVNSSVISIATKIEEFERHKTDCDNKYNDINAEWDKLGANYVLPDMGDCIIDGMQQKLDSIQSNIDLEKKQFDDIASGAKIVSKSQIKEFLKHRDRIPKHIIGKLEELSERADSILQIIGQQFSVLKTVVDTYLSEKGEYDKNVTKRETQQKGIEERLMKATAQIQENMGTLKEKTDLCNQQPQDLI